MKGSCGCESCDQIADSYYRGCISSCLVRAGACCGGARSSEEIVAAGAEVVDTAAKALSSAAEATAVMAKVVAATIEALFHGG